MIGNSLTSACVKDIIFANKTIRKLKSHPSSILFHSDIDLMDCAMFRSVIPVSAIYLMVARKGLTLLSLLIEMEAMFPLPGRVVV